MKITDLFEGREGPILIKANDSTVLVNGKPIAVDYRIIAECNYQKLVSFVDRENTTKDTAQEKYFKRVLNDVEQNNLLLPSDRYLVDITKENAELRRGIGDIMMTMRAIKLGETHVSIKNSIPEIGYILSDLRNKFTSIK